MRSGSSAMPSGVRICLVSDLGFAAIKGLQRRQPSPEAQTESVTEPDGVTDDFRLTEVRLSRSALPCSAR